MEKTSGYLKIIEAPAPPPGRRLSARAAAGAGTRQGAAWAAPCLVFRGTCVRALSPVPAVESRRLSAPPRAVFHRPETVRRTSRQRAVFMPVPAPTSMAGQLPATVRIASTAAVRRINLDNKAWIAVHVK